MAYVPTIATAIASPSPSLAIPNVRDDAHANAAFSAHEKLAAALLTPPNSISPDLPAHGMHSSNPPPMDIANETEEGNPDGGQQEEHHLVDKLQPAATPLSKGALSGLDAVATITPTMLAQDHLPGIMLGNGPRPIRYVMGELTQTVPGFSRIPPAKARRLVVAALESRHGGGPDGSVTFCKTGWGRWDAHVKGSSRDSGIGSFNDGHMSPPRSDRSSYAMSNNDSGVQMRARMPSGYRDQHSGGSWPASSLREEDELLLEEMDMDVPEHEADKMSLDGDEDSDSISSNEDTDEDSNPHDSRDWTTADLDAPRKASLPIPGAPRINYNAIAIESRGPLRSWSRRPSGMSSQRSFRAASLPYDRNARVERRREAELSPATATPEEQAAVAALLSLGSM